MTKGGRWPSAPRMSFMNCKPRSPTANRHLAFRAIAPAASLLPAKLVFAPRKRACVSPGEHAARIRQQAVSNTLRMYPLVCHLFPLFPVSRTLQTRRSSLSIQTFPLRPLAVPTPSCPQLSPTRRRRSLAPLLRHRMNCTKCWVSQAEIFGDSSQEDIVQYRKSCRLVPYQVRHFLPLLLPYHLWSSYCPLDDLAMPRSQDGPVLQILRFRALWKINCSKFPPYIPAFVADEHRSIFHVHYTYFSSRFGHCYYQLNPRPILTELLPWNQSLFDLTARFYFFLWLLFPLLRMFEYPGIYLPIESSSLLYHCWSFQASSVGPTYL